MKKRELELEALDLISEGAILPRQFLDTIKSRTKCTEQQALNAIWHWLDRGTVVLRGDLYLDLSDEV